MKNLIPFVLALFFFTNSAFSQSSPLKIGYTYTFFDKIEGLLGCYECNSIWEIKFIDKSNAILISRKPNQSSDYGACRSEVKYKYNSQTKTVTILSVVNENIPEQCKERFIGDWQWRKGEFFDMRFYSKKIPGCDFS